MTDPTTAPGSATAAPAAPAAPGKPVPAALAARIAGDLAVPPTARVGERDLGVRLVAALLGAQAGAAGVALGLGVRAVPDLQLALPVLAATAALTAGALALGREAIPGRGAATRTWAIAVALGALAYLLVTGAQERMALDGPVGRAGTTACLAIGALLGLVPLVAGLWVVRRGYVVRPRLAGFGLGVFAGVVGLTTLHLHCTDVSWAHTGWVHGGVVLVLGGIGAVVGGLAGVRRYY